MSSKHKNQQQQQKKKKNIFFKGACTRKRAFRITFVEAHLHDLVQELPLLARGHRGTACDEWPMLVFVVICLLDPLQKKMQKKSEKMSKKVGNTWKVLEKHLYMLTCFCNLLAGPVAKKKSWKVSETVWKPCAPAQETHQKKPHLVFQSHLLVVVALAAEICCSRCNTLAVSVICRS